MMVAAAVIGAGVVGAAATTIGANKAAGAQEDASRDANATQLAMYNQTRADNAPALDARNASLGRLQELLGIGGSSKSQGYGSWANPVTPGDVQNSPGYQFGLNQGLDAAQNSAAARGGLGSGDTLKALTRYGTDYATTKTNDLINQQSAQRQNQYNMLAGVGGLGQVGANQIAQSGQNYANQAGENMIGAGNARGAANIATGNAIGGALNQGAAWWMRQPIGASGGASSGFDAYDTGGYGIDPYGQLGGPSTAGDYSDERLKTDIRRVGTTDEGLPIYVYRYKAGGPMRMGVMAQEIERIRPDAVTFDEAGFRMVDYAKVA